MKTELTIIEKSKLNAACLKWAALSDDAKRQAMGRSRYVAAWVKLTPESNSYETCGLARFTLFAVTVRLPDGKTYRFSNALKKWALK